MNTSKIESLLRKDSSSASINNVVAEFKDSDDKFIVILYEDVPRDLREFVQHFPARKESVVFLNLCYESARELSRDEKGYHAPISIREVVTALCQPVSEQWTRISLMTLNASMPLADIKPTFGVLLGDCHDQLRNDLLVIHKEIVPKGNKEWIDERVQQLQCFFRIDKAVEAGHTFLRLRSVLHLTGSFDDVLQLCQNVSFLHYSYLALQYVSMVYH